MLRYLVIAILAFAFAAFGDQPQESISVAELFGSGSGEVKVDSVSRTVSLDDRSAATVTRQNTTRTTTKTAAERMEELRAEVAAAKAERVKKGLPAELPSRPKPLTWKQQWALLPAEQKQAIIKQREDEAEAIRKQQEYQRKTEEIERKAYLKEQARYSAAWTQEFQQQRAAQRTAEAVAEGTAEALREDRAIRTHQWNQFWFGTTTVTHGTTTYR